MSAISCSDIQLPSFPSFDIVSVEAFEVYNYTSTPGLDFCDVTVTLTHPGADDLVYNNIWLPLSNWNGRFVGIGGGGFVAGDPSTLVIGVADGFASASTDAGLTLNQTIDAGSGAWALKPDGSLNEELLENFAHRSVHDLTLVSKAAVSSFYGRDVDYSYFYGCSTGGRQGYFAAQRYPEDFDGIFAGAPAIYIPKLVPADFWPPIVMRDSGAPPQCVFDAYLEAITAGCDALDGVVDGLLSAPETCHVDTTELIGKVIECSETGGPLEITEAHAHVVAETLQGPTNEDGSFLWFGIAPGTPFDGIANTSTTDGVTVPVPFDVADGWLRYFVAQDPDLDTLGLSAEEFHDLFRESEELYASLIGNDEPDLSAFREEGGKLLTWHGLADPLIHYGSTLQYWDSLQPKTDCGLPLDDFYRVFLAPGAGHCAGGIGPVPVDELGALIAWVEGGIAPDVLYAETAVGGTTVSRNLCPHPQVLQYQGEGDVNDADSWVCN